MVVRISMTMTFLCSAELACLTPVTHPAATEMLAPYSSVQYLATLKQHRQRLAKGTKNLEQILQDVANGIDLRGLSDGADATMTPDLAYALGVALAQELHQHITGRKPRALVTGDHRWSTPAMCQALEDALSRCGVDVVRGIEDISTPAANIVARLREPKMKEDPYDALVQITASHNPWTRPKAQNGFKVNLKDEAGYLRGLYGRDLVKMLRRAQSDQAENLEPPNAWGNVATTQILDKYIEHMRHRWESRLGAVGVSPMEMKNVVLVVDSGNGVMGPIAEIVLESLDLTCVGVHDKVLPALDSKPDHPADPNQDVYYTTHLPAAVRRVAMDTAYAGKIVLGIALDGDGDRVGITDEAGEKCQYLTFAQQAYLFRLADHERNPGWPELLDIRSPEEVMEMRTKNSFLGAPGWPRIRLRMREVGAWAASESSRHEFGTPFPNDLNADRIDDGLWAALKAAAEAVKWKKRGSSLHQVLNRPWYPLLQELRPSVQALSRTERYTLITPITQKLRNVLTSKYGVENIEEIRAPEEPDAVRFRVGNNQSKFLAWILVRAGNSENTLSISGQGKDDETLISVITDIRDILREFPQVDQAAVQKALDKLTGFPYSPEQLIQGSL